jgi:hypothetical protein
MSLSIAAVSKAVFLTSDVSAELSENDCFVYTAGYPERLDGRQEGIYHANGEVLSFDVGGASDYFNLLEHLSNVALDVELGKVRNDPGLYTGRPFVELLVFSDNEGAIGPKTSRKLANDFATHLDQFQRHISTIPTIQPVSLTFGQRLRQLLAKKTVVQVENPANLLELYTEFHSAFELASDDGFVIFQ